MERKHKVYHKSYQAERMQDPLEHGRAADATEVVYAGQEERESNYIAIVHQRAVHHYYHDILISNLSNLSMDLITEVSYTWG